MNGFLEIFSNYLSRTSDEDLLSDLERLYDENVYSPSVKEYMGSMLVSNFGILHN